MNIRVLTAAALGGVLCLGAAAKMLAGKASSPSARSFAVRGEVKEVSVADDRVVVQHEEIPGYMAAMTMPFRAKFAAELEGLKGGDVISFQLMVTETESWIERITKTGSSVAPLRLATSPPSQTAPEKSEHPLKSFRFTNELGQAASLNDFRGQALAITFFFTRCPIPEYCPRLSRNFQEASQKLIGLTDAPTNWHFISVSFDTEFDTPAVLKAYAQGYQYDPRHWSFWTGPADRIKELASLSDVQFEREGGLFNHNFRTLVIDSAGHLQTSFPVGGDLSDSLVSEILKAASKPPMQ